MFTINAVRTQPSDDLTHMHVESVGFESGHMPGESIFISASRLLGRQAFGERFVVDVDGSPADVVAGKCPVCGYEPYLKTSADSAGDEKLLALPTK